VLGNPKDNYDVSASVFVVQFNVMYKEVLLLLNNYIRQFLSCTSGIYIRCCASFHLLKGHRSDMCHLSAS